VLKEIKVMLELMELTETMELPEHKVLLELTELIQLWLDHKEFKVQLELMEQLDYKVLLVILEHRVFKV
tara:strand:+ start:722 stop:928 length:207 start_codon:yes stop_codon:yes gene_type:complete